MKKLLLMILFLCFCRLCAQTTDTTTYKVNGVRYTSQQLDSMQNELILQYQGIGEKTSGDYLKRAAYYGIASISTGLIGSALTVGLISKGKDQDVVICLGTIVGVVGIVTLVGFFSSLIKAGNASNKESRMQLGPD